MKFCQTDFVRPASQDHFLNHLQNLALRLADLASRVLQRSLRGSIVTAESHST